MKTSNQTIECIKYFEGFSARHYICPAGYRTIGYGHLIKKHEDFSHISIQEANKILLLDIETIELAVLRLTNIILSQNQFDALVSFVFNLGSAAYQRSSLRAKVNRGDHENVPKEFCRWVYVNTRIIPGLVKRRNFEANLYAGIRMKIIQ